MSTYTYDATTSNGRVRLLIGDTDISPTTDAQFSDEEITAFLALSGGSVLLAASYALESWAGALSGALTSEKIGDYSYNKKEVDVKMALALKYRNEDGLYPAFEWSEYNLTAIDDTSISEDCE